MTKEQKFYKALQDVFIGAKIEGEGGFVNLMRIKSNYYRKIEDILKKNIEAALKSPACAGEPHADRHPKFRDELFDKLYSFFSRYFTESGSIYFNSTPFHNNIYEKVYTDEKDVILFWKTQMLYYVKTDRIFRSLPVEFDGFKFYFDASKIESKKANEKRSLVFGLDKVREDPEGKSSASNGAGGTIIFGVQYSERGAKTKQDEILKAIKRKGIAITEEQLERAFRVFEKQSEVDFFINKNAKAFLQEQFKLWSYQYFWEGAKEWGADRVNQLQILKDIAFKIIDFISQFEDELVKIWNKPKFVKNSNYVITLDRIAAACHSRESGNPDSLIKKIKKHKNYPQQVKEWKELGIDKDNPKAPIDTKYFKDLELEILDQFDDLDKSLDGWLIKSENYQALNTILPKFREKVQTIYIDPPFNLDSSDQFLYRTNYKDANWATLLENRLKLAKDVLDKKGSIFVRCDYNGNWIVRFLMDEAFNKELINEIQVNTTQKVFEGVHGYNIATNSLFWYGKEHDIYISPQRVKREDVYWLECHSGGERKPPERTFFGKKLLPPKGRHWTFIQGKIDKMISEGRIRIKEDKEYLDMEGNLIKGMPEYQISENKLLASNWTDIPGYTSTTGFQTENSEKLLNRVIRTASENGDLIMDFFLGSGTTTTVAHKLGRKWLGVEMGEHFYSVVLPRMKKVLAYDKSGISKEVKEYQGSGFFKYYELEQYEEALTNCKYEESDLFNSPSKTPYQEYVFMKDEKMLKALEIDYEKEKVKVDLNKLYPPFNSPLDKGGQWGVDIAETLSNLTGKWIKKVGDTEVEFEDGTKINTRDLDYKLIKQLIWWE